MTVTSTGYFAFLIALFYVYWLTVGNRRISRVLISLANMTFYSLACGRAVVLLIGIAAINYATSVAMLHNQGRKRQLLLVSSLTGILGALVLFKYAAFAVESTSWLLDQLGFALNVHVPSMIAPLGISFFAFQSIAYAVDVYRKDSAPAVDFLEYFSFISFFPTIVAGPILRARQLLPQLRKRNLLDANVGGQAMFLIAIGLIKKLAIADYLAANLVDRVFDFPERFSSLEVITAVYAYAVQIYADFSGYSDIAIGSALLLGLRVPENFNLPYRAASLPEFWRRWHISFSTWLRDYLFFSLIRSRSRSRPAMYGALVLTMLIGGLWHGPSWTFVLWGLLHGVGLAIMRAAEGLRLKLPGTGSLWLRAIGILCTFNFVCVTWIFFRAEGVGNAAAMFRQMSVLSTDTSNLPLATIAVIALALASQWMPERLFITTRDTFVRLPSLAQASFLFILAIGLYLIAGSEVAPFVYARF
jgi:alginate O-acetyltransferase complex protein AlgI